ncbi:Low molecular weight protein tyrosine phosphatase (EC [uncultured Gammaproteobacteria bacterium]|nr:Low molecular weight protein tyrosine phosphatase (EC [uncultured Gammaproteobacteria bacterium]
MGKNWILLIIPIYAKVSIKDKASTDSVINSDGWRGYNGLVDFGYKRHFRVPMVRTSLLEATRILTVLNHFGVMLKLG